MTLYATPEEHAANPPETWAVERIQLSRMPRPLWAIVDAQGHYLTSTYTTRKAATKDITDGPEANLWRKESAWYAGANIPQWKPWAQIQEERARRASWASRAK